MAKKLPVTDECTTVLEDEAPPGTFWHFCIWIIHRVSRRELRIHQTGTSCIAQSKGLFAQNGQIVVRRNKCHENMLAIAQCEISKVAIGLRKDGNVEDMMKRHLTVPGSCPPRTCSGMEGDSQLDSCVP